LLASRKNKEGHSTCVAVERDREMADTVMVRTIAPLCLQPQEAQLLLGTTRRCGESGNSLMHHNIDGKTLYKTAPSAQKCPKTQL